MNNKVALILLSSGLLMACGGGGGNSNKPTTGSSATPNSSAAPSSTPLSSAPASSSAGKVLQGRFKDTNVSGLQFVSGNQTGITDANGTFNYEQGQRVSFSVGAIHLGSAQGASLITPLDLVVDGNSASQAIINRVKFLLMLDSDGYSANGIQISSAVQAAAKNWSAIDFASDNFAQEIASIMSAASAADGGSHRLPDPATAKKHLETTHWCAHSGIFTGSDSTNTGKRFALYVNPQDGLVDGFVLADKNNSQLRGIDPVGQSANAVFKTKDQTSQVDYIGRVSTADEITGNKDGAPNETFSAQRFGGKQSAIFRYSATFGGTENGLLSFDVDSSNNISGVIYYLNNNTSKTLTGTLKGPSLSATTADNSILQGIINWDTGALVGSWSNTAAGSSGTFSGAGCQLNPAPITINGFDDWKIGFNTGSQQIIPASGTNPLVVMDGAAVAHVRLKVSPWGEMSFPIAGFDQTGEAETVDLTGSSFIEITYKSNQNVNLQLRQYAVHGGTHNQITLPAAAEFTTVKIPFSNFKDGLTPLDLTKVAKFNFALLSNNTNDGYAELIVKGFKIDKFN